MSSPHHETVDKARARVLEMVADPGMMGGDGIGQAEVDALIAAVRAEFSDAAERILRDVLEMPLDRADSIINEFRTQIHNEWR